MATKKAGKRCICASELLNYCRFLVGLFFNLFIFFNVKEDGVFPSWVRRIKNDAWDSILGAGPVT